MATYPTQDKEAMMKTESAILRFVKTLTTGLTETKPEIFYTEANVEKCRADILNALEKLGYHKGLPSSIEEALNSGDGSYRP